MTPNDTETYAEPSTSNGRRHLSNGPKTAVDTNVVTTGLFSGSFFGHRDLVGMVDTIGRGSEIEVVQQTHR